ncbi:uncharacterized protein P174DRAFT_421474 [Aspergillus novofumigatus IBT 16806]|uniref:Uncharacterized protein n=1 Tax=Aspergillus novofumigatus (strain IBT 16806) TaxID=1392255 RepID=A0A2I1C469_ASPN1|nr:uncharacterized protein P174DRAFT_421474 [Aspergillus novofumigatus IBT 16806]PKX92408.1 hypothetical protein P174DRAFT_421474 [Aspergillus novofumigatus IBT 16806]
MADSTASPFMNLLMEVHLPIVEHCDHASKTPEDATQQEAFLQGYELWRENSNKHACFKRRTMLAVEKFDDGKALRKLVIALYTCQVDAFRLLH